MNKEKFEKWINLDGVEEERTYHYPDGSIYKIENPIKVYIKESGSHKLIDKGGLNHYIRPTWNAFTFKGKYEFNVE